MSAKPDMGEVDASTSQRQSRTIELEERLAALQAEVETVRRELEDASGCKPEDVELSTPADAPIPACSSIPANSSIQTGDDESAQLLREMAEGTSRVFGAEFFRAFVMHVAKLFRVKHVILSETLPDEPYSVRTLAGWNVNNLVDSYEYDVRWGPCEAVVSGESAFHPERVRELFPRDRNLEAIGAESYCGVPLVTSAGDLIGHFCVIDDRPMPEAICDLSLVRIHLARAAAELERKQVEEKLRRHRDDLAHVSRLSTLGELAAGIAHELNQPLAAITNYTSTAVSMVEQADIPRDDLTEVLTGADAAAIRASEIVKRLRVLVGRHSVLGDLVDIAALARSTVGLLESDLESQKVSLVVDFEDDLPLVNADRIQLQQVLINLLRNAADAMTENEPEDRSAVLRGVLIENRLQVTVRDNGVGVGSLVVDHLFDPFFTTKADGMGMGLTISRSIIESHGGRLWMVPNSDRGASFHFTIPLPSPVPSPDR